jgi:hypothetical protein
MLNVLINEDASLAKDHPAVISFWAQDLLELARQLDA